MTVTYTVRSGNLKAAHHTAARAEAEAIALVVLERESTSGRARSLGTIVSVSGEQFVGDAEMYFATTSLLRKLGRLDEGAHLFAEVAS